MHFMKVILISIKFSSGVLYYTPQNWIKFGILYIVEIFFEVLKTSFSHPLLSQIFKKHLLKEYFEPDISESNQAPVLSLFNLELWDTQGVHWK